MRAGLARVDHPVICRYTDRPCQCNKSDASLNQATGRATGLMVACLAPSNHFASPLALKGTQTEAGKGSCESESRGPQSFSLTRGSQRRVGLRDAWVLILRTNLVCKSTTMRWDSYGSHRATCPCSGNHEQPSPGRLPNGSSEVSHFNGNECMAFRQPFSCPAPYVAPAALPRVPTLCEHIMPPPLQLAPTGFGARTHDHNHFLTNCDRHTLHMLHFSTGLTQEMSQGRTSARLCGGRCGKWKRSRWRTSICARA